MGPELVARIILDPADAGTGSQTWQFAVAANATTIPGPGSVWDRLSTWGATTTGRATHWLGTALPVAASLPASAALLSGGRPSENHNGDQHPTPPPSSVRSSSPPPSVPPSSSARSGDPTRTDPARSDPPRGGEEAESWTPDRVNLAGQDWDSHRPAVAQRSTPLLAAAGVTAVSGQVLLLNGAPLPGVTLSLDAATARSDGSGRFLLAGVPAGHHQLVIDGTTASTAGRAFGRYEVGVDLAAGQTLVLPYTIWMTRLDTANTVTIASPTTTPTVITTPKIPGFEIRLPAGTVIKDDDGQPVTQLSITAIPVDRPPFPLPAGVTTPVYFTVQPGQSYVLPDGAQIVYPNTTGLAPGTRTDFWDYDADSKGWYVYGQGQVTADGRQIVPDPGVRVWEFSGAMVNIGGLLGAAFASISDLLAYDGDPVDLGTGLFVETHTDLALPDVMPISITRTYRPADNASRPFGIGTNYNYDIFLQSDHEYTEADLVFPDSAKVHYVRTSPGTGYLDGVFAATGTTGGFAGSTFAWNGGGWDLVRADGMVYVFGNRAPLQAIRDRHGNQITISHSAGQNGNITQVTSPNGRWFSFGYDTANRIVSATDDTGRAATYTYDTAGRLTQVTAPAGVTKYGYDAANRMTTITDPRNIVYLTNSYDTNGRVASQTMADGGTYTFAYTVDANGYSTQTTVTDPSGAIAVTGFDTAHRVVTETQAAGTGLQRTTTGHRDPNGRIDTVTDPYGDVTTVGYNPAGDATTSTTRAGTPNARTSTVSYGGPYGQPLSTTDPYGRVTTFTYTPTGDVTSVTDPAGRVTRYTYDGTGLPLTMTDPTGAVTTFSYDIGDLVAVTDPLGRTTRRFVDQAGRVASVTDPLGAVTRTSYDPANNITAVTDPLGGLTTYAYDPGGNLTSVTDARGKITSYSYDTSGRVTTVTDPLLHTNTTVYDALGRVTSATDRRGKTTTASYDVLGRTSFVGYGTTTGPAYESTITPSYDSRDRITQIADTTGGSISTSYDTLDRPTTITSPTGTVTYTYDNHDRRTAMTATGQPATAYTYDNFDQLTTINQGTGTVTWHYDPYGRITSIDKPAVTTSYSYDTASQLTAIGYTNPTGAMIGDLTYSYDPDGRIAQTGGSLAKLAIPTSTFDSGNRLTARGTQKFKYDNEGNLTSDGTRTYTWNARGELATVTATGSSTSFSYDAAGRRTGKTVNTATTGYAYDGANLIQEKPPTGPVINRLTGAGLDNTLQRTDTAGARTPITDGLGSTIGLVDPTGTLATSYTYDPYGNPASSGTASSNTQQYTGREYDTETGLLFNRQRYYSPNLGRFISQDPAGFSSGSTNPYNYALNDPINLSDPNGDCPICAVLAVDCLVGGAIDAYSGFLTAKLTGRKYSVGDGLHDFAVGCVTNVVFGGLGEAFRGLLRTARAIEHIAEAARAEQTAARAAARIEADTAQSAERSGTRAADRCLTPHSFDPDTEVVMADGTHKPIKDVHIGDQVLATDPITGTTQPRQVTALHLSHDTDLTDLTITDNHGNTATLHTTQHHPIWDNTHQQWTQAGDLQPGTQLGTTSYTTEHVTAVHNWTGNHDMQDLTIDGLHTYYVVAAGVPVLVHNDNWDGFPDRALPRDRFGNPIPDSEYPHTQLGTNQGRRVGPYSAAREFGENGQPIRDIHFTDHGRPQNHTNPHQHDFIENETGGTPKHGPARPLEMPSC